MAFNVTIVYSTDPAGSSDVEHLAVVLATKPSLTEACNVWKDLNIDSLSIVSVHIEFHASGGLNGNR